MPASMGTAIHNSVEDLCNLDLSGRESSEVGWLPTTAKGVLEGHWKAEKKIFLDTPRHPRWKSQLISKANEGLEGALHILLDKAKVTEKQLSKITIGSWRKVQDIVLSNEGTLVSECGRLLGRLDLLISDLDSGASGGWIVADLKTGKPPKENLNEKVSRQLLFYRDLLKNTTPDHPPVHAEGWYSANKTVHRADGHSILEAAFEAWKKMTPTKDPLIATPSEAACSFCEWKAWCPKWWVARRDGELASGGMFTDEVVILAKFDEDSGAALFERNPPVGEDGRLAGSEHRFGAILKDRALEKMRQILESGYDGALFLGSARVGGKTLHLGDWSEIIPWSPLLSSLRE
tara:strand:+ start:1855 stop:2895 length:1041 start_codon:yes stop_codon:yes gene_type:complete